MPAALTLTFIPACLGLDGSYDDERLDVAAAEVTPVLESIYELEVRRGILYAIESDGVYEIAADGSTPRLITSWVDAYFDENGTDPTMSPRSFAVGDSAVLWTGPFGRAVFAAPIGGGDASVRFRSVGGESYVAAFRSLVTQAGIVYVGEEIETVRDFSSRLIAGPEAAIAAPQIARNGSHVIEAYDLGDRAFFADDGVLTELAGGWIERYREPGQAFPNLTMDANDSLYWTDAHSIRQGDRHVYHVGKDWPHAVAATERYLYVAVKDDSDLTMSLQRVDRTAGIVETIDAWGPQSGRTKMESAYGYLYYTAGRELRRIPLE